MASFALIFRLLTLAVVLTLNLLPNVLSAQGESKVQELRGSDVVNDTYRCSWSSVFNACHLRCAGSNGECQKKPGSPGQGYSFYCAPNRPCLLTCGPQGKFSCRYLRVYSNGATQLNITVISDPLRPTLTSPHIGQFAQGTVYTATPLGTHIIVEPNNYGLWQTQIYALASKVSFLTLDCRGLESDEYTSMIDEFESDRDNNSPLSSDVSIPRDRTGVGTCLDVSITALLTDDLLIFGEGTVAADGNDAEHNDGYLQQRWIINCSSGADCTRLSVLSAGLSALKSTQFESHITKVECFQRGTYCPSLSIAQLHNTSAMIHRHQSDLGSSSSLTFDCVEGAHCENSTVFHQGSSVDVSSDGHDFPSSFHVSNLTVRCDDGFRSVCNGAMVVCQSGLGSRDITFCEMRYESSMQYWFCEGDSDCVVESGLTERPTSYPTTDPTQATITPTMTPITTISPSITPSLRPSEDPTVVPSADPSRDPTFLPTFEPSLTPIQTTLHPSDHPTTTTSFSTSENPRNNSVKPLKSDSNGNGPSLTMKMAVATVFVGIILCCVFLCAVLFWMYRVRLFELKNIQRRERRKHSRVMNKSDTHRMKSQNNLKPNDVNDGDPRDDRSRRTSVSAMRVGRMSHNRQFRRFSNHKYNIIGVTDESQLSQPQPNSTQDLITEPYLGGSGGSGTSGSSGDISDDEEKKQCDEHRSLMPKQHNHSRKRPHLSGMVDAGGSATMIAGSIEMTKVDTTKQKKQVMIHSSVSPTPILSPFMHPSHGPMATAMTAAAVQHPPQTGTTPMIVPDHHSERASLYSHHSAAFLPPAHMVMASTPSVYTTAPLAGPPMSYPIPLPHHSAIPPYPILVPLHHGPPPGTIPIGPPYTLPAYTLGPPAPGPSFPLSHGPASLPVGAAHATHHELHPLPIPLQTPSASRVYHSGQQQQLSSRKMYQSSVPTTTGMSSVPFLPATGAAGAGAGGTGSMSNPAGVVLGHSQQPRRTPVLTLPPVPTGISGMSGSTGILTRDSGGAGTVGMMTSDPTGVVHHTPLISQRAAIAVGALKTTDTRSTPVSPIIGMDQARGLESGRTSFQSGRILDSILGGPVEMSGGLSSQDLIPDQTVDEIVALVEKEQRSQPAGPAFGTGEQDRRVVTGTLLGHLNFPPSSRDTDGELPSTVVRMNDEMLL